MRRWRAPVLAALGAVLLGAVLGALLVIGLRREPTPARPPPPPIDAPPPRELPIRLLPSAPAPARDGSPATFEGRVVDAETRAGVAGAELTFSRGGLAATVHADARGAFLFRPPSPGRWQLAVVTGEGHLPFA